MLESFKASPRIEDESLSDYAFRIIRDNILRLKLKPNTAINEDEIAIALGMSRTPVHEAIAHLNEIKLVDIYPRKKTKISRINLMQVNEGLFARCALEEQVVPMIIGKVNDGILSEMQALLDAQQMCVQQHRSIGEFCLLDRDFHSLFYKALDRDSIGAIIRNLDLESVRMCFLVDLDNSCYRPIDSISYQEHVLLYEIICGLRPLDFDIHAFLYNHISRFRNNLEPYITRYRDYFSFTGTDTE